MRKQLALATYVSISLIVAQFIILGGYSGAAQAQEEADWPSEIDYPPGVFIDPTGEKAEQLMRRMEAEQAEEAEEQADKKWWQFWKEDPEDRVPTEEEIVNVGPRTHPAAKDPLLPLSVSIRDGQKIVLPGFYLVQQQILSPDRRTLTLMRQGQPVYSINVSLTGTQAGGPVEPKDEDNPTPPSATVTSRLSSDHRTVVIVLVEGDRTFESAPLPTALDHRRRLY